MRSISIPSVAALSLLLTATANAASMPMPHRAGAIPPGTLQPMVLGATAGPRLAAGDPRFKLDGRLRTLARAYEGLDRGLAPASVLDTLHRAAGAVRLRLHTPQAVPQVLVDAIAGRDAAALKTELDALGFESTSTFRNDLGGWLPVNQLAAAVALGDLRLVRAPLAQTRAGAIKTQGDYAQRSDVARSYGVNGSGVKVGVLSDSYNCYPVYAQNDVPVSGDTGYASNGFNVTAAMDVSSGDLPSNVQVLQDASCMDYGAPTFLPFGDEGRAMMQIVHDVAPGASLSFYTAVNSEADFANGILALANAGADIIVDDIGYSDEPFYQDGVIAQAVDQVQVQGVVYFSAAGNNGVNAYENLAPSFPVAGASGTLNDGQQLLNFDTSGATVATSLPVSFPVLYPGEFLILSIQWDQPYVTGAPGSAGASSQLTLCVHNEQDPAGTNDYCAPANAIGGDPQVGFAYGNPANSGGNTAATTVDLTVGLVSGAAPGRIKLLVGDNGAGAVIQQYATNSATIQGHAGAAGALSTASAFYYNTPRCGATATLDDFASAGGTPILFDTSGNRLATPIVRNKPDFVAPDGGNDTFLGFVYGKLNTSDSNCQSNANYPNFFGTSAAAPHAAGVAALLLQALPGATPTQIGDALRDTAIDMNGSGFDFDTGYGFIQADAALTALDPSITPPPAQDSGGGGGGSFGPLALLALAGLGWRRRRAGRSRP